MKRNIRQILHWRHSVAPLKTLGLAFLGSCLAGSALADTEIGRRWASTVPVMDGVVSPGEWTLARATPIAHGQMRTMNNATHLFVLLDVVDDTVDDAGPPANPDYFRIFFDVDLNGAVTPNVDFMYSSCQDGQPFIKAIRLSQYVTTTCQTVDPQTTAARGFGPTFNSATAHRFWEFRLALTELGVDASTWTTSAGAIPKVRMSVGTRSVNPSFFTFQPDPSSSPNNANMYQLDLATYPIFPPGSTGPTFAGVGLVPFNFIDPAAGYATINIAGYYYAKDAPFGGKLNVFGNWFSMLWAGAAKYRVLYSKDFGPWTRLRQTWTNFKFNGTVYVPTAIGPDANDAYEIPAGLWYLPDLLISWQSDQFPDGTYRLKLELLTGLNTLLPEPPGNQLTLFVVNTPPTVTIKRTSYDVIADICECGIVTQGDAPRGFTWTVTVNDPNGALNNFYLSGTYGKNQPTGVIHSETYDPGHVDADGPRRWNGVTDLVVPTGPPWRAPRSCAYTFYLAAASRVQNGYGLVFPYVDYKVSLTILRGAGAGGVECPPP